MTAVATRQAGAIAIPALPDAVAQYLAAMAEWQAARAAWAALPDAAQPHAWDGGQRPAMPALTPDQRNLAADAADDMAAVVGRRASAADIRAWLMPVNAGVRNPQDGDAFALRASAIALACHDIPAAVFDRETQVALLRAAQFFPSVADVLAVVQPVADRLRRELAALEAASRPPEPPKPAAQPQAQPPRGLMTMEERKAHAQAAVASLKPAAEATRKAAPVKPHCLTREQLNAAYAAAGIPGPQVPK